MTRTLLFASWMLLGSAGFAADKIEALDDDFLDYLADLESDDDNWTLLDDPDRKPASKQSDTEQLKPAAGTPSKEAARPAVEER